METTPLKDRILALIDQRPHLSFVELLKYLPEASGDHEMVLEPYNVVLWKGLSSEAIESLRDLERDGLVEAKPAPPLVYWIDGGCLRLPLMKRKIRYRRPRWLPVTFNRVRKAA